MIKSMTGFGQALGGRAPFRWAVEIRSWNHRFFECTARLPNILLGLEERIRDLIHTQIKRGKITVAVSLRSKATESNHLVLDEEKINFYIRTLRRIQKKYNLQEAVSVNALFGVPGLFTMDHHEYSTEQYWAGLRPVLVAAIGKLLAAKGKEGSALMRDLNKRVRLMERSLGQIELISKTLPLDYRNRLKERVAELTQGIPIDSGRLEQEVALQAERSDITEELVRTNHHLEFMKKSLEGSGESGKKLDFIAQEIHREVNTIASKAQSSAIAEDVIRIKSELEKIREQVQNIE